MEIGSNYNDVNQRWIIVDNKEIEYLKNKSTIKRFDTNSKKDLKVKIRYEKQKFACEIDTIKALEDLKKKLVISDPM